MYVCQKNSGDPNVYGPSTNWEYAFFKLRQKFEAYLVSKVFRSNNTTLHSTGLFSSKYSKRINLIETDLVHLHWINYNMLSIADIGRISKPTIWTIHDMWPFCGAEHITSNDRWQHGYSRYNRPITETGVDLNKWIYKLKQRHWKNKIQIVAPSNWMAKNVSESRLMNDWPVEVIHNPIDSAIWKPMNAEIARSIWGLPQDKKLVMFGALGGGSDPNKGFDLLLNCLQQLNYSKNDLEIVIFGEHQPKVSLHLPYKTHYLGHIYDEISLITLYNSVDVTIIPSRIENLPNTAMESLSCGIPVVAFDIGGISDLVVHKMTGYLAKRFDCNDLAYGIKYVIDNADRLKLAARDHILKQFSIEVIIPKYLSLYKRLIKGSQN